MDSKVIDIHQSFWGEANRGHGLIATSLNDDALNQVLLSFSDRPGSTLGQSILPYFSGKKIENYFVFAKSYPDDTSSRTGMVFTHALIFNINDILSVENIDFVFDLFSEEMPEKPALNASINSIRKEIHYHSNDNTLYPKYLQTVAQLLVKGKLPIIFSGKTSSFILLITKIWKGSFSSIKENLTFQIAFTPNDIQHNKNLSFIFVPETFVGKWTTHPIVEDKEDFNIQIESDAERLLLGDLAPNAFYTFIQDLNIQPESFKTISICYRAYQLYCKLNECTASEVLQLVRSLATLSPHNNANRIKSKSLEHLCLLLANASEDEIKGLRNIDFSSFEEGNTKITKAIELFWDKQFQNTERNKLSQFIFDVFETKENVTWWHHVIIQKISRLLKDLSATDIWDFISIQKGLLVYFEPHIVTSHEKETQFLSSCPKGLNLEIVGIVRDFSRSRKWFRLFAKMNLEIDSPQSALLEQLSLEKDVNLSYQYSGLDVIITNFSDKDFVEFAVKKDIEKLNHIAADKCVKNPHLLSLLDVKTATWRKVWAYSLEKTDNLPFGIPHLQTTIFEIFDLLLQNISIEDLLIEKISKSEYANIKDYPNRIKLWNKIPVKYQPEFVLKTSDAIIDSILNGNDEEVEIIIVNKILSDSYIGEVCNRSALKSVLLIYDKFIDLNEKYLLSGIKKHVGNLDKLDSNKLGLLVRQKSWGASAEAVFVKAKNNPSFLIALNQCAYLISKWKRLWYSDLFNETFSESDYYDSLCELAIELYERGPEENNIWKKAGGDVSILTNTANRKEQWYSAIQYLRKGGGGKEITAYSLLEEIKKDKPYRYSTEINKLMEYFKKK
ncbi:hypothetical protein EZS27_019339 [termite gut metagenome]|uniref:Uncharacterized protein n=1 Tax=termite gut metagenome TaxID=433724 RepID=A0A5J4RG60_9ZZZZ